MGRKVFEQPGDVNKKGPSLLAGASLRFPHGSPRQSWVEASVPGRGISACLPI